MRLVNQSIPICRSRPRQALLLPRRPLPRINGVCRGCKNDIPSGRLRRRPQATLCRACVEERLECLSADAL
jgi:RNA polymerase-binding transcription factor DksA